MKHVFLSLAIVSSMIACQSNPSNNDSETSASDPVQIDSSATAKGFDAYLALSQALIKSDAALAKTSCELMKNEFTALEDTSLTLAIHYADSLTSTDDIEMQRAAFQHISEQWYDYLKKTGSGRLVYKQFCPMAFKNQGAYWLSDSKDILNPYFGDAMLKCGRVDESF